jgi:hypothetical protein
MEPRRHALGLPAAAGWVAGRAGAILDAAVRALVPPGGRVLLARPCPDELAAGVVDAGGARAYVDVGRRHDLRLDLDGLRFAAREPDAALLLVDTPGDPTGTVVPAASLRRLAAGRARLLVDRRGAADGGAVATPGVRGRCLELLGPRGPAARALLVGPAGSVAAVAAAGGAAGDGALGAPSPADVDALLALAAAAPARAAATGALRARLARLPGLLVAPGGGAAHVYVRVLLHPAATLADAVCAAGGEATAYPGSHAREGVRIAAPRGAPERDRVVAALAALAARRV